MRLRVEVVSTDVSEQVLIQTLQIRQSLTDRSSQLSLAFIRAGADQQGVPPAVYGEAQYDVSIFGISIRELYDIAVIDVDTGVRCFGGTIRQIKPERKKAGLVTLQCDCLDYSVLLEEAYVVAENYTNKTDQFILQDLITRYQPKLSALAANVQSTVTIPTWTIKERSLREAIDELIEYTGCDYRVDYYQNFLYFKPRTKPAPWGLSDHPNNSTTFPIDAFMEYSRDAIKIINRCTFLGAALTSTTRLKVTYDDPVSQQQYGVRSHTLIDEQITDGTTAILRAKQVVVENAYPRESLSLKTLKDGLQVGLTLAIRYDDFFVDSSYQILEMGVRQLTRTKTEYSLTLGLEVPDVTRVLKMLDARTKNTGIPTAIPADGSVTDSSIAAGGLDLSNFYGTLDADNIQIDAGSITGTITAGQDIDINAAVINGTISAANNVIVEAGTIQGVIQGNSVKVDTGTFQGLIITDQLANGILDDLGKYAASMRPVRMVQGPPLDPFPPTNPPLPNDNYPPGSYFYYVPQNLFYKMNPDGVTAVNQGNNPDTLAGILPLYHIGALNAKSINGLILSNQIKDITVGQINGQITAAKIDSVNASVISGSISSTQGVTIDGQVITGNISAAYIGNITAAQISTSIQNSQIAGITADKITTSISHTQIGTINAATITVGFIGDGQISSINGGKITAQSIDSSKINADNITVGGSASQATNPAKINVVDSNRQLCAQVGYLTTTQNGGWFKFFGAGGDNYNNAKIKTSETVSGFPPKSTYSLDLLDANLSITNTNVTPAIGNTSVYTSPTTFEATYSSIALNVSGSNQNNGSSKTMLVTRGLVFQNNLNTRGSFNRHSANEDSMELVIYNGGTIQCHLNGPTGVIGCTGFFSIRGQADGKGGQFTYSKPGGGQGVLNFVGGIMTGGSLFAEDGTLEWTTPPDTPKGLESMSHLERIEYDRKLLEKQQQPEPQQDSGKPRKRRGLIKRILGIEGEKET